MERNDNIEAGQECTKSNLPEEGVHAGDSIIPAFLKIIPSDSFVEWQEETGLWHTNMAYDITKDILDRMPENPIIQYVPYSDTLIIRRMNI